ncbi:hypothetical protein Zmor_019920 [Zophobas morio]|uniref:Uncharacterized protein n=1 Tax=Zophobas morio TaxID=2755281 RepID=A0AA38M9H4_9CUCU|nr:hypothetical protein Zmor_019920 [Zophobas morio]
MTPKLEYGVSSASCDPLRRKPPLRRSPAIDRFRPNKVRCPAANHVLLKMTDEREQQEYDRTWPRASTGAATPGTPTHLLLRRFSFRLTTDTCTLVIVSFRRAKQDEGLAAYHSIIYPPTPRNYCTGGGGGGGDVPGIFSARPESKGAEVA